MATPDGSIKDSREPYDRTAPRPQRSRSRATRRPAAPDRRRDLGDRHGDRRVHAPHATRPTTCQCIHHSAGEPEEIRSLVGIVRGTMAGDARARSFSSGSSSSSRRRFSASRYLGRIRSAAADRMYVAITSIVFSRFSSTDCFTAEHDDYQNGITRVVADHALGKRGSHSRS